MKSLFTIILACFALSSASPAQQAHYRKHGPAVLPDPRVTPGKVNEELAKVNPKTGLPKICDDDFRTEPYRHVTPAMHRAVYAEYGVQPDKGMCAGGCEDDHLISIELAGDNDNSNRWPQPSRGVGYHVKDIEEGALHRMVCSDKITLGEAQKCIAADWYACGIRLGIFDARGHYLGNK